MVQIRLRPGFVAKARDQFGVARKVGIEELDCNNAVERTVDGLVDHPHAALPEHFQNTIAGDIGTSHEDLEL